MDNKKVETPEMPPAPVVNEQGIKIYPTSFLPQKAPLEPSRVPTAQLTNFQIEVIHIVIFALIVLALYWSMWVKAKMNREPEA